MQSQVGCLAWRGIGAPHEFDTDSGWCIHGCGLRDDGRQTFTTGQIIHPGPEYTPADLAWIADNLTRKDTSYDYEQQAFDL